MSACSDCWWSDIFLGVDQAGDEQELLRFAANAAVELGFTWCSYGLRIPVTAAEPAVTILASYPTSWIDRYVHANYVRIDPTVRLGLQQSAPIVWSDRMFATAPQLWREAQAHGLRFGIAQSSWQSRGAYGLFSMARERGSITTGELRILTPRLRWLADNFHRRMQHLVSRKMLEGHTPRLSERERDVLRWTADGKTSWEVGQILAISQSTVNFHINNIVSKLQVQNKIQAAAKASALGLLDGHAGSGDDLCTMSELPRISQSRSMSVADRGRRN